MHIHTIIKTKANTKEEAIDNANGIITDYGEYQFGGGCDYVSEEDTQVLDGFTEEQFKALRDDELAEYKEMLEKALTMEDTDFMKGYYLTCAGNSLQSDVFWYSKRYAYTDENNDGDNTYYVTTDRHF